MNKLHELLYKAIELDASDIHLIVNNFPIARVNGRLIHLSKVKLNKEDTYYYSKEILKYKYEDYNFVGEIDCSYSIDNIGRFRVNVFKQCEQDSLAIRIIKYKIPTLQELNFPKAIKEFCNEKRGLILVTGPTGSGKSTTVASIINEINENKDLHILTLEEPIEFLHESKKSIINQREVGKDSKSYSTALKAALREDPDVIFIGEMRDIETISIAIRAAETGHLVLSTLHTLGADATIDRIVDVFPANQQQQIKTQLSFILKGIISQQLVEKLDGKRTVALEIMKSTPAISNLIREGKNHQIKSLMQTGARYGMETMDNCLMKLYKNSLINFESALDYAIDKEFLKNTI